MSVIRRMDSDVSETAQQIPASPPYEIGVVEGTGASDTMLISVAAHIPTARFRGVSLETLGAGGHGLDAVIVPGSLGPRVDALLTEASGDLRIIVILDDPSVANSRHLLSLGAADILAAPVTEPALTLSLERIMRAATPAAARPRSDGAVVALLKAGGGVGATFLATQMAAGLGRLDPGKVCIADLDIQFGVVSDYLDADQSFTVADIIGNAAAFSEASFSSALAEHKSGCRILSAPKDVTPLESLTTAHIETIVGGLRRTFSTTLLDLPPAWTLWSFRALQMADRIVLVTQLSVPHMQLVKRQLRVLSAQKLDHKPIHLVLNAVSAEQLAALPVKVAEKAIGRTFDLVIPEDRRTAGLATNQGIELNEAKSTSKLGAGISQLAALSTTGNLAAPASSGLKLKFW